VPDQYQALGAAFETIALLESNQRSMLESALRQALEDPDRAIEEDASPAQPVDAMLLELRS
jgi:hypothetical protein